MTGDFDSGALADDQERLRQFLARPDVPDEAKRRAVKAYDALKQESPPATVPSPPSDAPFDVGKFALDVGPEMALSGAGEVAGTALGGLPGGMVGAGAGGLAGRALSTYATEGRLPTGREAALTFGTNAAAPPLAKGAMWVGRRLVGRGAPEAVELYEAAQAARVPMSAGEMSPSAARIQAGLDKLPTSGGVIENLNTRQNAALADYVREAIVGPRPPSLSAAGAEIHEDMIPALAAIKRQSRANYERVSRGATAAGIMVPMPNDAVVAATEGLGSLQRYGIAPAQGDRTAAILDAIVTRGQDPNPMPYREVDAWLRDLRNVAPTYQQAGQATTFDEGILSHIKGSLDRALDDAVQGTQLQVEREGAKRFFRDEVVPLRQAVAALNTRSTTMDQVVDLLVRNRRPDRLRVILDGVDPATAETVRASWFEDTLMRSTDAQTGEFSPQRFLTTWARLGRETQDLLSGGQAAEVGRAIRIMQGVQARRAITTNPSKTAFGLGAIAQGGLAVEAGRDIAAGNLGGATLDIAGLVAPPILSRIFARPGAARYFAMGLTAPPGSSQARLALDQLGMILGTGAAGAGARHDLIELREGMQQDGRPLQ